MPRTSETPRSTASTLRESTVPPATSETKASGATEMSVFPYVSVANPLRIRR